MEEIIGMCPFCQTSLERSSQDPAFIVCPAGDYRARESDWEERWIDIQVRVESGEKIKGEELLRDLRALHTPKEEE